MDLKKIMAQLSGCPCGRAHTFVTEAVRIEKGLAARAGALLCELGFSKKVLLVSDSFALGAAGGLLPSLEAAGFLVTPLVWERMVYARREQVDEVLSKCDGVDAILSVGTGSVNDICRVAAYQTGKDFCIFATAPSMDGFASDTAPIIENNFKTSWQAEQPRIILADTAVLAKAPGELKAAGFGDMMAKYMGIMEWKMSHLLVGEYYCPAIAELTLAGVRRVASLADKVQCEDEEAAAGIMEGLIFSGLAMKLAASSRPASGAEHVLSHYLECYKLARGIYPELHGKKVGVATALLSDAYHRIATRVECVSAIKDPTDWDKVRAAFDESQHADLMKLNTPTVTDGVDPARLSAFWPQIREMIFSMLPSGGEMRSLLKRAGAVTEPEEVHVDSALLEKGLRYHSYMRHRILLTRLLPMLGLDIMDFLEG